MLVITINMLITVTDIVLEVQSHNSLCYWQLLMGCPALEMSGRTQVRAGVAAILGKSVRSAAVRELCAVIKKEESVLSKLQNCTRNPVILIVDKVGCTHTHLYCILDLGAPLFKSYSLLRNTIVYRSRFIHPLSPKLPE